MWSSFGFCGIIISLIFDFSNGKSAAEGCWDTSAACVELCDFCDENFYMRIPCYEFLLKHFCLNVFSSSVSAFNTSDMCLWNNIKRPYSAFTECTEAKADCLGIPWPNRLVESIFVGIHATYFKACAMHEFDDPSPHVVLALVVTPVCLIPILVALVVVKTKDRSQKAL